MSFTRWLSVFQPTQQSSGLTPDSVPSITPGGSQGTIRSARDGPRLVACKASALIWYNVTLAPLCALQLTHSILPTGKEAPFSILTIKEGARPRPDLDPGLAFSSFPTVSRPVAFNCAYRHPQKVPEAQAQWENTRPACERSGFRHATSTTKNVTVQGLEQ